MIAAARESAGRAGDLGERASFFEADMLGIAKEFRGESFDLILCLGNTLPHLIGQGASDFLGQARSLIAPGGALVLQTLNFSLPRIAPGFSFPELSGA